MTNISFNNVVHTSHQVRYQYFFIIEIIFESVNLIEKKSDKIEKHYHQNGEQQLSFLKKGTYQNTQAEQKERCSYNYRAWFGQPIIHFLKYQKTRRKTGQKARGHVKSYRAACFTSYFVSCFPIFQEMENTRPHEILHGCVLSYAAALLTW